MEKLEVENFDLSHVPVYVMGEEQLSRYAIYMATLGNRPDLFPLLFEKLKDGGTLGQGVPKSEEEKEEN